MWGEEHEETGQRAGAGSLGSPSRCGKAEGTSSLTSWNGGLERGHSQLRADHHEQQGEGHCHRQAQVQVQQNGGHKGHQPDELQTDSGR